MLGVGKAAPAQFVLRRITNLRRISAAGQKAGFTAYLSHWASLWWNMFGGQRIFFVNTMQQMGLLESLTTAARPSSVFCALFPVDIPA